MLNFKKQSNRELGFTLIEIIVSTAIFVVVVSAMLGMFNYTLQINRRVQSLREVVQGTRTFAETLTREIRNGRIDYKSPDSHCAPGNYISSDNKSLALVTKSGDKLCFYFDESGQLTLNKRTPSQETTSLIFNSPNFSVNESTFHFVVFPQSDPNEVDSTGEFPKIQPFVTTSAQFILDQDESTQNIINYQTTISTDVYDIRK